MMSEKAKILSRTTIANDHVDPTSLSMENDESGQLGASCSGAKKAVDDRSERAASLVARTFPDIFEKDVEAKVRVKNYDLNYNIAQQSDPQAVGEESTTLTINSPNAVPVALQPGAFPMPGAAAHVSMMIESSRVAMAEEDDHSSTKMSAIPASLVGSEDIQLDQEDEGEEEEDIERAVDVIPLPTSKNSSTSQNGYSTGTKRFVGCLVLVGIAVTIGVVLAILLMDSNGSNQDDDKASNNAASGDSSKTTEVYPPYDDGLMSETINAIQEDPTSPQYKANAWMIEDPYLNTYPKWRQTQRFKMAIKYFGMQGDDWFRNDNWLSYTVPECEWWFRNDEPCDEEGKLVMEDLSGNNLIGAMPMEAPIETLRYIDNSNNEFLGGFPPFFTVSDMEVFIMSNNSISGAMTSYGGFEANKLRIVKIDNNQMEDIPVGAMFWIFPALEVLNFTGNSFDGELPTQVPSNHPIRYLGLANNHYTGPIPTQLGLLSSLQGLDVSGNSQITGSIPLELASLQNLTYLNVADTSVMGVVPEEICTRAAEGGFFIAANCSQVQCC